MLAGRRGLAWAVLLVSLLAQVVCGAARPPYPRPARRLPPPSAPLASLLLCCARFASAGETAGPGEGSTERTSPHNRWAQCCGAATCCGLQPAHSPLRREMRHVASVKQPGSSDLRVPRYCGAGRGRMWCWSVRRYRALPSAHRCGASFVCLPRGRRSPMPQPHARLYANPSSRNLSFTRDWSCRAVSATRCGSGVACRSSLASHLGECLSSCPAGHVACVLECMPA